MRPKSKRQNTSPAPAVPAALREFVLEKIRRDGPVPFSWFMEQALYHGIDGYYSSGRAVIGRGGDYFTNVSVGPLFGRLLAVQFAEMWEAMGRPEEFTLVEQGAHDGTFAHDVLTAARSDGGAFGLALHYRIAEPFAVLRGRQQERLREFGAQVDWYPSVAELPPFEGMYFSNELLDAMPVHAVRWEGGEWLERHVAEDEGELYWKDLPLVHPRVAKQLAKIPKLLPDGYETEVNLAALDWLEAITPRMARGFVTVVDYGFPRDVFYAPHRSDGTLRAYAQHRVVPSPLVEIGEIDITAHIEWTSLAEQAQQCGLSVTGFTDQHHFITGLLAGSFGDEFAAEADPKTRRALQTLLHPAHLGMKFQFLVLSKGVPAGAELSGLRFARSAALQLV